MPTLEEHLEPEQERDVEETRCWRCTRPVLVVELVGEATLLDVHEVESPRMPCPSCTTRTGRHKGHVGPCDRCGDTGVVGQANPQKAIAVGPDGSARRWDRSVRRAQGESLYVEHICAG